MIACIPTKGRPNTKTYKLFQDAGIEIYHFIEPQEINKYDVPHKIDIGKNDGGISYVRNFMLQWAKDNIHEWIIMCDDDVTSFGIYNGKTIKKGAHIWKEIKLKAEKLPFELIGINYTQHAWHEKTKYSINKKFAEVCVLMNVNKIKWHYRGQFDLKEDRDFALQTIRWGNGILRFNHYWFSCPDVSKNKGGLQEKYQNKIDEESIKKMCKEYSPFIKLIKKKDRVDGRIDIKAFAQHHNKIVK